MDSIGGLPAHILLVHLVVVILPLAGLLGIVVSVWPAARHKLTFLVPLAALGGMVVVPLATRAGRALAARLGTNAAIIHHQRLASGVLPWAVALAVTTTGQWAYFRYLRSRRWATALIAGAVIVAALGTVVWVVLTGDAGSRAVWGGVFP